jgi:hypothetical protein
MTVTWMIAIEQDYNSAIMDTLLKILATGALTLPLTLIQSDRNKYSKFTLNLLRSQSFKTND